MSQLSVSVIVRVTVIFCLLSNCPASGWYKQTSSPHYYSVGRASGLLQGIRRSEHLRPDGIKEGRARDLVKLGDFLAEDSPHPSMGQWDAAMMFCVKEVTPQFSSCSVITEDPSIYNCKANVRLTFPANSCNSVEH
ncbi:neuropeptide B-like [Heterodontus francisci]|uniref:neuropeptide B-like n=1 Tax=Heterodontus francisci TaxID=7792 RepID=UPI00355C3EFB